MKFVKITRYLLLPIMLLLFLPTVVKANSPTSETNNLEKKSEVEVVFEGEATKETKNKETIYTPTEAKSVNMLPKTGEIITTFMYVIVGISMLLFLMGILISSTNKRYVRWEY